MQYLLQGFLVGLAYVAPIGMQNLFVINTALTQSKKRAFATAFIVIFFDVTLALACFFGIGGILTTYPVLSLLILGIGGSVVIWIGFSVFRSHDTLDNSTDVGIPITKVIWSACVVTWFNPQALIDGTMLLGASRASLADSHALQFILGCNASSFVWFLGITLLITLFSAKFNDKILRYINIVCGLIIIVYGVKLIVNFFQLLPSFL
ncbi:MAG: LysE family transporter [Peptostreptococcaceae bacterium]|nr:LysE family transporter [Peptostreptococcaceae bacterium]